MTIRDLLGLAFLSAFLFVAAVVITTAPHQPHNHSKEQNSMAVFNKGQAYLHFAINATDLSAGTTQYLSSPIEGDIEEFEVVVQEAIVTGGVLKLTLGSTDVVGATVTVANSATVGTVYNAATSLAATTRHVTKGQAVKVTVDAAFNGGGAVRGWVRIVGSR
jgi:hypothetical protein